MPEGICVRCGQRFFGWAVETNPFLVCDICGGEIIVEEE